MSVLEIEEKTIEDAIAVACQKLNLPREKLEFEIISKGSSGIFGIVGAKKAKIRVTSKVLSSEGAADRGKEILGEILKHVDLPTVIESEWREDQVYLNIISNGTGLLIGKRGQTLDSLQLITNRILNKKREEPVYVIVDTEGYRQRHMDHLRSMAVKMGQKAKRTGQSVFLEKMNPYDRRIIHLALKNDDLVNTKSIGDGVYKKVIIVPKRAARS